MVRLQREDSAQATIEYALFLALILLTVIVGIEFSGGEITGFFNSMANSLGNLAQ